MCPIVKSGHFGHTLKIGACVCTQQQNSLLYLAAGPMVFCVFDAVKGYAWPGSGWRSSACEAESTSPAFLLDVLVPHFCFLLFVSPDAAPPPLAARRRRQPPPSPRARCTQVNVAVGVGCDFTSHQSAAGARTRVAREGAEYSGQSD